jgi:glycosyltransferase involved in cell wall biosynthesis
LITVNAFPLQKPLRVFHYIGGNFGITGIETFVLHLCAAQKGAGLAPSIILDIEGREQLRTMAEDHGATLHALPTRNRNARGLARKIESASFRAAQIRMLVKILRRSDVLHIHELTFAIEIYLAARIAGVPKLIVTHHASMTFHKEGWTRQQAATFWLQKRWASRIVLPYKAASEEYIAHGVSRDRASIVPYCVDQNVFTGLAGEPEPGELVLVMAARLVEGKGHRELIAALAQLAPHFPRLRLLIAGVGPLRSAIEAEVERAGLRDIVEFRGQVDLRAMPELLRSAHVVVLPSYMWGETFPLCLLEGMAVGLPAIATRWFGIPDIVEDGETGILVEPRDVETLAQAIRRFLTEPGEYRRTRRKAVARFNARYTSAAVAAAYSEFYRQEPARNTRGWPKWAKIAPILAAAFFGAPDATPVDFDDDLVDGRSTVMIRT